MVLQPLSWHRQSELKARVRAVPWLVDVLLVVRDAGGPGAWTGGGVLRDLLWDAVGGTADPARLNDVDVAIHDGAPAAAPTLEARLRTQRPDVPWEVVDQALVHTWYPSTFGFEVEPLLSVPDGIATWPTTAAAVALRIDDQGALRVLAPFLLTDLLDGILRRNPRRVPREEYARGLERKDPSRRWPWLRIVEAEEHTLRGPWGRVVVAPVEHDDAPAVHAVLSDAVAGLAARRSPLWQEGIGTAEVRQAIDDHEVWLARDEFGTPVGTLRLQAEDEPFWGPRPDDALYLHRLAVRASHRGLGRLLLSWTELRAATAGRSFLRLDCAADEPELCGYYEQAGYTRRGVVLTRFGPTALFEKGVGRG